MHPWWGVVRMAREQWLSALHTKVKHVKGFGGEGGLGGGVQGGGGGAGACPLVHALG